MRRGFGRVLECRNRRTGSAGDASRTAPLSTQAKPTRIGVVGAGRIGSILATRLGSSRMLSRAHVRVSDPDPCALHRVRLWAGEDPFGYVGESNDVCWTDADVVVLAVKPKDSWGVLGEMARSSGFGRATNVVSVVAGLTTDSMRSFLGTRRTIARAMPNITCASGKAPVPVAHSVPWGCDDSVTRRVIQAIGRPIPLAEATFDAATALYGSGPALVLRFMLAMTEAGVREGMTHREAGDVVASLMRATVRHVESISGGMHTARHGALHDLIQDVCSPAGTTVEALHELDRQGFSAVLKEAVSAAANRSRSLSVDTLRAHWGEVSKPSAGAHPPGSGATGC